MIFFSFRIFYYLPYLKSLKFQVLRSKFLLMILITLIILMISSVKIAYAQKNALDPNKLRNDIKIEYLKLLDVEEKGANITSAAIKLNSALQLIVESNGKDDSSKDALLSQAASIVAEVNSSIPSLINEGSSRTFWGYISLASTIVFVIVASLITYFYLPKMMWNIWFKLRQGWRIESA